MTLNHHGNRDASNGAFMRALAPRVVIQQSWCSDQPGQELAFRLADAANSPDTTRVFNNFMQEETKSYLGFWITNAFKSLEGHLLIRVDEGGKSYTIYVLNDRVAGIHPLQRVGPYNTRNKN